MAMVLRFAKRRRLSKLLGILGADWQFSDFFKGLERVDRSKISGERTDALAVSNSSTPDRRVDHYH